MLSVSHWFDSSKLNEYCYAGNAEINKNIISTSEIFELFRNSFPKDKKISIEKNNNEIKVTFSSKKPVIDTLRTITSYQVHPFNKKVAENIYGARNSNKIANQVVNMAFNAFKKSVQPIRSKSLINLHRKKMQDQLTPEEILKKENYWKLNNQVKLKS